MADSIEEELSQEQVKKRAIGGIAAIFVRQAVMRLLGFAATLILARLLSPEIFGVFAVVQFVLTFFNQLSLNGITAALVRRKEKITSVDLGTGFILQLALTAISVVIILIMAPVAARFYNLPVTDVWLFRAVALALVFSAFKVVPTITLQRALRFERVALADILEQVIYITAAAVLAFLKMGVWSLVLATCLRGVAGAMILAVMGGWDLSLKYDAALAKEILRFAIPMQVVNLTTLAYQGVIPLIVAPIFGAAAAGVTSTARTLIEAFTLQPLTMISGIQLRLLARVQDDLVQFRRLMNNFIFFVGAVCFPIIAVLSVFAGFWLPALLSAKWLSMTFIFMALAPAYVLRMTAVPYSQSLKALGRTRVLVIATAANVLVLGGGVMLLSKWMGLICYAIATVIGDAVFMCLMLYALRDVVNVRSIASLIGPSIATFSSLIIWIPAVTVHLPAAVRGAAAILGVGVYLAVLVIIDRVRIAAYLRLAAESIFKPSSRISMLLRSGATKVERFGEEMNAAS